MFSRNVQTWLLGVLVVMAAIGLVLLYIELQNAVLARKNEMRLLRRRDQRKPSGSVASDSRSQKERV